MRTTQQVIDDKLRYALCKQLPTVQSISSSYGDFDLDDEMRKAVGKVLSKIIEKRLIKKQEEK